MINLGFDPLFEGEENKREMVSFFFCTFPISLRRRRLLGFTVEKLDS